MKRFDYGDMAFSVNSDNLSVALVNKTFPGAFSRCTLYRNRQPMQKMDKFGAFYIPEEVKDESGKIYTVTCIANGAFDSVDKVVEIHIPKTITKIKWSFWECVNLQRFVVSPNNKKYCAVDGVLYSKDKKALLAYPNAKGPKYKVPNGVEEIANCAFKNTSIEHITASATLQRIGQNAFYGCGQLEWIINIPRNIVEVANFHNPGGAHTVNPNCKMDNGTLTTFQTLIKQYPTKKTK